MEKLEFKILPLWRTSNVNKRSDSLQWQKEADYFLPLDDESKQRYKVKINNIQGYDPIKLKKGITFRRY